MYVLNTESFGYYSEKSSVINLNSYLTNQTAWEEKYIDAAFKDNINLWEVICTNVHKIKIFTPAFCEEVINMAENTGSWSQGGQKHYDNRIGNVENHPTQDIHMKEIGLEDMWKFIVETYIKPIIWKEYHYSTRDINISFIVKYSMNGQKELQPHHDSSTYTVNICLNTDFEGGRHDKRKVSLP